MFKVLPEYTTEEFWNIVWRRPYSRYEKHHQLFWGLIKEKARGRICDLGCGTASCWKGFDGSIVGVDFSIDGVREASKNCPNSTFIESNIEDTPLQSEWFDTVVLSGVVNYYRDLEKIRKEVLRISKKDALILVTINVINDFPDREWNDDTIESEFFKWGKTIERTFYPKVGWLIEVGR